MKVSAGHVTNFQASRLAGFDSDMSFLNEGMEGKEHFSFHFSLVEKVQLKSNNKLPHFCPHHHSLCQCSVRVLAFKLSVMI